MKIAFLSSIEGNTGPDNVHKALMRHWSPADIVRKAKQGSFPIKTVDCIIKGLFSDIVFSAGSDWAELISCWILHAFGKPILCFNHGYVPYENKINNLGFSLRKMAMYKRHLSRADKIVANSKYQMEFIARMQPELSYKLDYVDNAVDPFEQKEHHFNEDGVIRVAVSGGTRPIKGNEVVARAICLLNNQGHPSTLTVYGREYADNSELTRMLESPGMTLRGQVPHDKFIDELQDIDVFVMNSRHEPFGLSALDAIQAGASVLLSRNCGVADVLHVESQDLIDDCESENEIAEKILWVVGHRNSIRLYKGINFKDWNWANTTTRLRNICLEVVRPSLRFD